MAASSLQMGGDMEELEPLLHGELQGPWEAVDCEYGPNQDITMQELFQRAPNEVIKTLQNRGVSKLGELKVPDVLALNAFNQAEIITIGSDTRDIDYAKVWKKELNDRAAKDKDKLTVGWETDLVLEAYVVNIKRAASHDKDGLLHPLLLRWQAGALSMSIFGLPAVQAVVNYKWEKFARKLLMFELCLFLVWLASFFVFTWLFQDENLSLSLFELVHTPAGIVTVICQILTLLAVIPFIILEHGQVLAYGFNGYLDLWNGLDLLTHLLQLTITGCYLTRTALDSEFLTIACAAQCVCLLFKLQFYSRVFKSTRFAFLEAVRDVVSEIRYYFLFWLIILVGFAGAFHILFRQDQKHGKTGEHFSTISRSILYLFSNQEGLEEIEDMLDTSIPKAAVALAVAFQFIMGMVLSNIIISIMTGALERVNQNEALKWVLHKIVIIDELELTIPPWLEAKFPEWSPCYVHVLRIDPDRVDRVQLGELWQEKDGEGGREEKSGGGGGDDIGSLQNQLQSMQQQLDRLEKLMRKEDVAS